MACGKMGGMKALGIGGGPMVGERKGGMEGDRYAGQYEGAVGPPSYQAATTEGREGRERKSLVGRWIEKRKRNEEERREETVPDYVP